MICRILRDDIACATSSGAGRYFDGIAAILGMCSYNHFEAQAAMLLEAAATRSQGLTSVPKLFQIRIGAVEEIDLSPLAYSIVSAVEAGESLDDLAWMFHEQLAQAWAEVVRRASQRLRLRVVGLTGGVFCNAWLAKRLSELLVKSGLQVLRHRVAPPNDGGIALGQAAIAAARMRRT
jgi:hydrogenase maturation protein HypF